MTAVILSEKQQILREIIEDCLSQLKKEDEKLDYKDRKRIIEKMGQAAHDLHMSIDPKPRHRRYMIENRGMAPDNPKFYFHIHPAEDLIDYLDNIHANDDPEDQTLNETFYFSIYSRRWGHNDRYELTRTAEGWKVHHLSEDGNGDKTGWPILYDMLDKDSINYPKALPGYMEWLWNQAEEMGLSRDEVAKALDYLAEWVSICERSSPGGIFGGYK